MSKFEIVEPTEMLCVKFQTRSENHGEAKVTAMDLRVRWRTQNTALDMLHKQLREHFCSPVPDQESDQGEMALEANGFAFVRFSNLAYPMKWAREYTGYILRLDFGTGGDSDMIVKVCKLHNFNFTPLEGGLVDIEFTISSSADISERFVGHMGLQQQKSIFGSLLPPLLVEGAVIDASSDGDAPGNNAPDDDGRGATDEFIEQHAPSGKSKKK